MNRLNSKRTNSFRRKHRVRTGLSFSDRPRLSVVISNRNISAQIIDDSQHKTLVSTSSLELKAKGTMTEKAVSVGKEIAKKSKGKKIKQVAMDRGSKLYHGRVKALADAAREEGLVI